MESADQKNKLVNGISASGSVTTNVSVEQTSKATNGKTEDRSAKQANGKTEDRSAKQANGKTEDRSAKQANGKTEDKLSKLKGIQDDPTTSKVYKSLFTSSDKAKNQQKPHWVTFNPMYYWGPLQLLQWFIYIVTVFNVIQSVSKNVIHTWCLLYPVIFSFHYFVIVILLFSLQEGFDVHTVLHMASVLLHSDNIPTADVCQNWCT